MTFVDPSDITTQDLAESVDGIDVVTDAPPDQLPKLYDMFDAEACEVLVRSISSVMTEGVLLADQTGKVIWHNLLALQLFQLSSDELLERRLDDERWAAITLDGAPYQFHELAVRPGDAPTKVASGPIGVRTGDSRLKWLRASVTPIDVQGGPHTIVVFSDITDQITERRTLAQIMNALRETLVPVELPDSDVVRFAAGRRDGSVDASIGADFYGVGADGDTVRFTIGDSFGSGAQAVALSMTALTTLRTISGMVSGPAAAADRLDDVMDHRGQRLGVTAVCGRIEREYGIPTLSLVCAGHALPILIRGGRATQLGAMSPMIGVAVPSGRTATSHELRSGDIVITYTDGLTESAQPALSAEDLLARIPVNVAVDVVVDTLMRMYDAAPGVDDGVAVFGFEVR